MYSLLPYAKVQPKKSLLCKCSGCKLIVPSGEAKAWRIVRGRSPRIGGSGIIFIPLPPTRALVRGRDS